MIYSKVTASQSKNLIHGKYARCKKKLNIFSTILIMR